MRDKIITIVGGTGFIGRYVVQLLAEEGYTLRVIARNPDAALHLKTAGDVGQVVLEKGDLGKPDSLRGKLDNSWAVVNLVGVLYENAQQNFAALHSVGAERLAQMARAAGAQRYVHISSLGVDKVVKSKYARTKSMGEKTVKAAFPDATILRPSVVFGAEDQFYNNFARLGSLLPFMPLIGGGMTRFQPVYVMDVARAVLASLKQDGAVGQTYELGGPVIYSFREILRYIATVTGHSPWLVSAPFGLMRFVAAFTELLPNPPLTRDQIYLLEMDNVVSPGAHKFSELGIVPTSVEAVVPQYLSIYMNQDYVKKTAHLNKTA